MCTYGRVTFSKIEYISIFTIETKHSHEHKSMYIETSTTELHTISKQQSNAAT